MANPIFVIDIGPDGVVATHPARIELPVMVAAVPEERKDQDFNAIRSQLVTIACMKLPGQGFEFDSSFISPNARTKRKFTKFAELMKALQSQDDQNPKRFPPCSVFGHADPTGTDEYNKTLAGRRARAVYGLLVRDTKLWDALYNQPFGGDRWGIRSIRTMLSISLQPGEPPFYTGPIEPGPSQKEQSDAQKQTHDAVAAYQESRSLLKKRSGFPGDKTREKLFREYMDAICQDDSGTAFQLVPDRDFLSKRRDGGGLKGDVQGCGEFNEIFLLSKEQEDLAKKDKTLEAVRNEIYRADRRVVVYVFKHGTEIDPTKWPCPRSTEGPSGCTLRFWSDYQDRRKRTSNQRTFGTDMELFERDDNHQLILDAAGNPTARKVEETGNTMACRWYHGFAIHSPCERKMEEWIVRIRFDSSATVSAPMTGRRFVVVAGESGSAPLIRGTTNDKGEIRIPVFDEQTKMKLKLDAWGPLFEIPADKNGVLPASSSQKSAAPPTSDAGTKPAGGDPDAFPDEDKFMNFVLDAGALRKMAPETGELPSKQRLYNLGFRPHFPVKFTNQEFNDAVKAFRISKGLGTDSNLDSPTRDALEQDHELSDPGPPPDDENSPPAVT